LYFLFFHFFLDEKQKYKKNKKKNLSTRAVSFERSRYGSAENFRNLFMRFFFAKKIRINMKFFPTKPGHFSRTLSKGPNTTTWIWNLHADAHDFDSHTSDLEEISRKVFSAHFGQLGVIFIWLSGCETLY
jgi:hypothetical protein